ncbi:MAG: tetratricopeptide repeat protein [Alistipes sp.]|nr:tetratricopeptide repeat protein [Alistipes sp.]
MFRRTTIVAALLLALAWGSVAADNRENEQVLLDRAKSLLEHGRAADARHEYMRLKEITPSDNIDVLQQVEYGLTVCAVRLDDNIAEQRMKSFLTHYPGSVHATDVRFLLAMHYCETEQWAAAKAEFESVPYKSLTTADRERYDVRMGYICFLEGDYSNALTHFNRVPAGGVSYEHALYYISYINYSRGDIEKAYKGFVSLKNSEIYSGLIPFYLLQLEFDRENYKYVVDNCDALLAKSADTERNSVLRLAAEAWFRLDGYGKALQYITAYAKSVEDKMSREDNYLLGYTTYRTADYAGAVAPLKAVCTGTDNLAQNASYHLADCYVRLGDKKNAIHAFALAADERFNNDISEDALFNYGKLLFETGGGLFNESINVLTRYITRYPDTERAPEAKELLIAAYYNSRDYDMAYDAIRAFPNPDGSMKTALQKIAYYKGIEAFEVGDYVKAKSSLEESMAVGVSPKYNALCAFWLGEIAYQNGDMSQAVKQYNFYLKRAPRNANEYKMALYNLGYANIALEDIAAAQKALEGFIWLYKERDEYRADGYNRLADVHFLQKNYDSAVKNYEGAVALGTEQSHYARYRRALSLGLMGKKSPKIEALKGIISEKQGDYVDDASYELGRTYLHSGSYSEGAKVLETLVADYPSSPYVTAAMLDLGLTYFNLGDSARSLKSYDAVISAAPQSQAAKDAMNSVREIYVSKGDVSSYFAYAERTGVECDLSALTRDSLSYRAAEQIYLAGRTDESIAHFENYIASNPKGYYIDDALFCLSDSYLKCDSLDRALESMKLLSDRPKSRYTVPVLEKLAQVTSEHKMYTEASSAYRRLYDLLEDAEARRKVAKGYVESTILDDESALILAMAADVDKMEDIDQSVLRKAHFSKAKVLVTQNSTAEALDIFRTLSADKGDAVGAESAYRIICHHFELGEYDKAEALVYEFADSRSPQSYFLGKAFIVLGDIYASKSDIFQARATYQSIVDGYTPVDDGVVDEAKKRIEKLQ